MVVTCLDQLAMPFIRYEQGDICRLRSEPCPCGRATPVMDPPFGRNADMITLPCGRKMTSLRLDTALRAEMDLLQYRFVQERRDHIRAELCFRRPPDAARLEEMRRRMVGAVAGDVAFSIQVIPEMRFEGIKFKTFVSMI